MSNAPSGKAATPSPCAERITRTLTAQLGALAEGCGATAIFVYADALAGAPLPVPDALRDHVIYVTKTSAEQAARDKSGVRFVPVPNVPLTRAGQVKIAVLVALARGLIHQGDVIVFLTGLAGSGALDSVLVTEVGREYEFFSAHESEGEAPASGAPQVLERVIEIATQLGLEGREGKPAGALFVIGDTERVLSLTRQLILNPFRGYPETERNILSESLEETVKELSGLDGAFVLRDDGVIETCGAFLKTASQEEFELPQGLGTRHHAAAAITAVTGATAVTVSESTGTVTVFRQGRILTEIEKPRVIGARSRKAEEEAGKGR